MSNTPTAHKPHAETEEPQLNWEKHLRWLAPVTAGILIVATIFMWSQGKKTNLRSEVMQAYSLAGSAEDLQTVADAYPDEPEAPMARLQAGALFYNKGDYSAALAQYDQFLKGYPSHPMYDNALWGKWMSQEALGNLEEALTGFRSVKENALLYPQALMGQARILEKQGNKEGALTLYTQIQEMDPESSWAEQARVFADRVNLK